MTHPPFVPGAPYNRGQWHGDQYYENPNPTKPAGLLDRFLSRPNQGEALGLLGAHLMSAGAKTTDPGASQRGMGKALAAYLAALRQGRADVGGAAYQKAKTDYLGAKTKALGSGMADRTALMKNVPYVQGIMGGTTKEALEFVQTSKAKGPKAVLADLYAKGIANMQSPEDAYAQAQEGVRLIFGDGQAPGAPAEPAEGAGAGGGKGFIAGILDALGMGGRPAAASTPAAPLLPAPGMPAREGPSARVDFPGGVGSLPLTGAGAPAVERRALAPLRLPAGAATAGAAPPPSAVDLLRQNPEYADQFDAKYGVGAAARVLAR